MNTGEKRLEDKNFIYRKIVHIAFGFLAYLMKILGWKIIVVMSVIAIFHNAFLMPYYFKRIYRKRFDLGIILYPVVVLISVLIYKTEPLYAALLWVAMAFGDGFSAIAGKFYGGKKLLYNDEKTVFGSITFFIVSFVSMTIALLIYNGKVLKEDILFALFLTIFLTIVETLPLKITDNAVIVILGIPVIEMLKIMEFSFNLKPEKLTVAGILFLILIVLVSIVFKLLTIEGGVLAFFIGAVSLLSFGYKGIVFLIVFFILSYFASFLGRERKKKKNILEVKRGILSVLGKGFFPFYFALIGIFSNSAVVEHLFLLALLSATFDTVSGEVGKASSDKAYKLFSLRSVESGEDGAVSFEGFAGGLVSLFVFSMIAILFFNYPCKLILILSLISFLTNLFEPLIKAFSIEKKFTPNLLYIYLSISCFFFLYFKAVL